MTPALVAALGLALVLQTGCARTANRSPAAGKRVIVLGIDGMDPKFLDNHWSSLPNLDALRKLGEFKRLATTVPPQSPVAWSTFITGLDPDGHGIYDFVHRNPETALPYSSMAETAEAGRTLKIGPYVLPLTKGTVRNLRKGRAFWDILAERGVPVNVIRMPTNYPPIECEGNSLAGMGTPDLRGTFGTFSFYTSEAVEKTRQVPGGQIFRADPRNGHASLRIEGPPNTLREDRSRVFVHLEVDVDPSVPVARFETDGVQFVLRQGEWSEWIPARFPFMPGPFGSNLTSAAGMFRVYAKQLRPSFQIYVSPININPADPALPISSPVSYSKELAKARGPFYTQGMAEDTAALRQGIFTREEYLSQARLVAQEHLGLLDHALEQFQDGLLFFHFFGVDQNSHMLWGKYDQELLESYKLVDQALGRTLQKAGDATVIVMSDHGFSSFDRAVHLNSWLMREGFLTLDGSRVDWSKTQAYALGLNGLYINLSGRERNGIVRPEERDAVMRKLKDRLLLFRDPDSSKAVIDTVYTTNERVLPGAFEQAPDLIVGYHATFRASWETALGAVPAKTVEDNTEAWIGDHCVAAHIVPGVLLSNRRSRVSDPKLADLTVSLLAEFGIAPGQGMKGRAIF